MGFLRCFLMLTVATGIAFPAAAIDLKLPAFGNSEPLQMPPGKFIAQAHPPSTPVKSLDGAYIIPLRADADGRIFPADSTQAYLKDIVGKLVQAWPHQAPPVDVRISTSFFPPADYHALATPDNTVVIYLGVLEQSETEDEVAFILAHELSHILLGHMTRDEFLADTRASAKMALKMGRMAGTLSAIDFRATQQTGQVSMDKRRAEEKEAKALKIQDDFRDSMGDVFIPLWSRKHEDEADLLAIDLMTAAGYAPLYSQLVFERLVQASELRRNRFKDLMQGYQEFMSDIPPETIASGVESGISGDLRSTGRNMGQAMWERVKKEMTEAFKDSVQERLRATHRDPQERMEGLTAYMEREYAQEMERDAHMEDLEDVRGKSDYASLLKVRGAIMQARAQLALNDAKTGFARLTPAVSGHFSDYGEGRWLQHRFYLLQEQNQQAMSSLRSSSSGSHPGVRVYEKMFAYYWQVGQKEAAQNWLSKGEQRFGDSYHFLPERIFVAVQGGESHEASHSKCSNSKKDYLHPVCIAAEYAAKPDFRDYYAEIYCNRDEIVAAQNDSGATEQSKEKQSGLGGALGGMMGGALKSGANALGGLGEVTEVFTGKDRDGC